ncbi:chemotaxis protein CheB [Desulfonema magnum]|uniref:protein-glutamate methylesterase n=1 Tax=Desulfonema magnum TaxID=45655 RepID=A0A975BPY6_9BACT|nr:chemotaxis protein CheB [Desulfonema magnum]QTA89223.1 Protein-glutamate methylesterase/protein-glutamine glutaminase 2 [Desulfonema magnum]
MKNPIKLLIVDDSRLMRRVINKIFDASNNIQVVGEAANGKEALDMIPELNPDVVTLDINMPVMDGLTALKHIMIRFPRPVVMLSTLTQEGAAVTFDALKYGAVDFIHKPSNTQPVSLEEQCSTIVKKISLAAGVEVGTIRYLRTKTDKKTTEPGQIKCNYICAIGVSEGGYGTLLKIIPQLQSDLPAAILVVLYEASRHVDAFARYLDDNSPFKVKRAVDGESVEAGFCYLVSGKQYVTFHSFYGEYSLAVNAAPFTTHKGGINMLMFSLAEIMKEHAMGVILSGSGNDGAEGLQEILRSGGTAIIQEPKTCLYKEMAISAIHKCKAASVIPDGDIAAEINKRFSV